MNWRRSLALLGTLVLLLTVLPLAAAQPLAADKTESALLNRPSTAGAAAPARHAGQAGLPIAHSEGWEERGRAVSDDPASRTIDVLATLYRMDHFVTPTAGFTDNSPVCFGMPMAFTNTTIPGVPPPTTYLWNFGDGTTSTVPNPVHTYAAVGTYTVTLTACNNKGMCDTADDVVEVQPVLTAGFTFAVNQTTVTFTDTSQNATSWLWDFGDGITDTVPNPVHTYGAEGTYTVTERVFSGCGTDTAVDRVTVGYAPDAGFTDNSPVCLGLPMAFTNTTSGTPPIAYLWNFGDGGSSTETNPIHLYAAAGPYTVTLEATNDLGASQASGAVQVLPLPASAFTYTVSGAVVTFTNLSQNATSWLWDFGDGITDTVPNPVHTYTAVGTYTITLWASGACGTDTAMDWLTVRYDPDAGFLSNSPVCLGLPMLFTNTTTGTLPISYLWDFGDGGTSSETNPIHLYAAAVPYTVTLDVTNASGSDRAVSLVEVLPLPASAFTYAMNGAVVTFTNLSQNATSYLWDFGDSITDTAPNPVHTFAAAGTYTVTLLASGACGTAQSSQVLDVTWCVNAVILSTITQTLRCGVGFGAELAGDPPFSYLWDFGPFGTSTETNPIIDFGATGTYTVTLDVWNCAGNGHDTVTFPVRVACGETYQLYLPLIFKATP